MVKKLLCTFEWLLETFPEEIIVNLKKLSTGEFTIICPKPADNHISGNIHRLSSRGIIESLLSKHLLKYFDTFRQQWWRRHFSPAGWFLLSKISEFKENKARFFQILE